MTIEKTLYLSSSCKLTSRKYDNGVTQSDVEFDSDEAHDFDISRKKAIEIIEFLMSAQNIDISEISTTTEMDPWEDFFNEDNQLLWPSWE